VFSREESFEEGAEKANEDIQHENEDLTKAEVQEVYGAKFEGPEAPSGAGEEHGYRVERLRHFCTRRAQVE